MPALLSRVLIAEDEPLIASHLREMLEAIGAGETKVVGTLGNALREMDTISFSLAIVDVQLGTDNGLLLANRCREDHVPTIISTGYGAALGTAIASDEVLLHKPFTFRQLEAAVQRLGG